MCKFVTENNDTLPGVISFDFDVETDGLSRNESRLQTVIGSLEEQIIPSDGFDQKEILKSKSKYLREIIRPDKDGDNLLMMAIILGKTKLAMMLINLIPNYRWLSKTNRKFQTALHLATLTDNYVVIRRLIVAGVKIHKQDWRGNTALHIACRRDLLGVARALLKPVTFLETKLNSYDIPYQPIPQNLEIRNSDGLTCFLIATVNRNTKMMDVLIDNEADINAVDMKSGKTCLHYLAESGDNVLMKHMLSKPCVNVNARTYSGHTALQIAKYRGHDQVAYLLRCAGAAEEPSDDEHSSD